MADEDNFKRYGNYLGICVENRDPEYRGRVKIFIPHIMPALQENWNESGFDITIDCVGNNLQNGLDGSIIDKLRKILPWAECASPVFGASTAGSFNPVSSNFNQTNYTEGGSGSDISPSTANFKFDQNVDENLARYTMSIAARETGFNAKEANSDFYNGVASVKGQSYYNSNVARGVNKEGLSVQQAQAKYGDYGYFQTNQTDVDHAVRLGVPRDIASAMNNGGGKGNYSPEQQARATALYIKAYRPDAAAAASRGDFATANALLKGKWPSLPGGKSYRPGNEGRANAYLSASKQAPNINDPTSDPDPSSLPVPPMPQAHPEGGDYTTNSQVPSDDVNVQTTITGGGQGISGTVSGKSTVSRGSGFESAFKQKVLNGASGLKSSSGTTLCGQGTRKAVGLALGDSYYSNTGFGTDITAQTVDNGYWTKKGDFTNAGNVKSDYRPQQGDVLIHSKNKSGTAYGHAQVYLDGKWHSWKSDDDVQGYMSKSGQESTLMRLTDQGKQKLANAGIADASALGKDGAPLPASGSRANDEKNDAEGDYSSNISKHTTSTQATPLDTTGMAQGLFSVPNPGALLWVFFREGNPLFPVYFAASYGSAEWASVYTQQSPPLYYPKEDDISAINNEATFRPNSCGAIKFNGTVTKDKDYRSIKIAHANGGFHELHATGTIHYSPNEHVEQIGGNRFSYCLNKEEWVQGTDNRVTIGNQYIVVGTPTQANIKTIEELTQKVKAINEEMLKD